MGNSILWKESLSDNFEDGGAGSSNRDVSDGKSLPKTTLIAGGSKLDQLLIDPYQSYYSSLVRHVHGADAILICGYGFSDVHVNDVLWNRLKGGRDRIPVMVLDWSNGDPMPFRADDWSHQLYSTLWVNMNEFAEPGYSIPADVSDLVARGGFEVNGKSRVAIWHGGMSAATPRLDAILAWLQGIAEDRVLAGSK
jgi:hypothetical protein